MPDLNCPVPIGGFFRVDVANCELSRSTSHPAQAPNCSSFFLEATVDRRTANISRGNGCHRFPFRQAALPHLQYLQGRGRASTRFSEPNPPKPDRAVSIPGCPVSLSVPFLSEFTRNLQRPAAVERHPDGVTSVSHRRSFLAGRTWSRA